VFSNLLGLNDDYDWVPDACKSAFEPAKLDALFASQSAIPQGKRPRILVILDDLLGDRSVESNKSILSFFARGRHALCRRISALKSWSFWMIS
jgi:hypothetical protein